MVHLLFRTAEYIHVQLVPILYAFLSPSLLSALAHSITVSKSSNTEREMTYSKTSNTEREMTYSKTSNTEREMSYSKTRNTEMAASVTTTGLVFGAACFAAGYTYCLWCTSHSYVRIDDDKGGVCIDKDVFDEIDDDDDDGEDEMMKDDDVVKGNGATAHQHQQRVALDVDGDEVVREQLTRNIQLFGIEATRTLAGATVIVVGVGGVGSHAAAMLCRSGVGKLVIVDFDQVTLSSLNRHAVATRADVGKPKTAVLRAHLARIFPECEVVEVRDMYDAETEERVFAAANCSCSSGDKASDSQQHGDRRRGGVDFVVDAIDNIDTKVDLLAACVRRRVPVLSCGGAGAKVDPTRLTVVRLEDVSLDPLCRSVRYRLKRKYGIESGIDVLMSTEKPVAGLIPAGSAAPGAIDTDADAEIDNAKTEKSAHESNGQQQQQQQQRPQSDYQIVPNFRVGIIPVLGTTPAIFGMAAASWVLTRIAHVKAYEPRPIFRLQSAQLDAIYHRLIADEADYHNGCAGVEVDHAEVVWLARELWRCRSAWAWHKGATKDKGLYRSAANLTMTRWDARIAAKPNNLVLMTIEEAEEHRAHGEGRIAHLRAHHPEFVHRVENMLRRAGEEFALHSSMLSD